VQGKMLASGRNRLMFVSSISVVFVHRVNLPLDDLFQGVRS